MFTFTYIMGFLISALMFNHWAMGIVHQFNPNTNGHMYEWDPLDGGFWGCAFVLYIAWWAIPFIAILGVMVNAVVNAYNNYNNLHQSVAALMQNRRYQS